MPSPAIRMLLNCLALASAKLTTLDKEIYPRDFKQIPVGTDYGEGDDM